MVRLFSATCWVQRTWLIFNKRREPGRHLITPGFTVNNVCNGAFTTLVLDVDELPLTNAEKSLSDSLAAYRSGDLIVAMQKYPPNASRFCR